MTKIITLDIGPRNCGKSLFVERELNIFKKKIYIGTLRWSESYRDTIARHQARRDKNWMLFEVTSDFQRDLAMLRECVERDEEIDAVMIDGLITWFLNVRDNRNISPQLFAGQLTNLIKSSGKNWFLVDVNAEIFAESEVDWRELQSIHKSLISNLNILHITDWNYERI